MTALIDLAGQRFGKLVVLSKAGKINGHSIFWNCQCDCGNEITRRSQYLRKGVTTSCGCAHIQTDLTGMKFGRLTVIREHERKNRTIYWLCRCDCGQSTIVWSSSLRTGNTQSCGCLHREITRSRSTVHGHANRKRASREYTSWSGAKKRCTNTKDHAYARYGGRGIQICRRWADNFEAFLQDMGTCPPNFSLDRINNDGNYEPGNCRWATPSQQRRNQRTSVRVEYKGAVRSFADVVDETGADYQLLYRYSQRLKLPIETAIELALK